MPIIEGSLWKPPEVATYEQHERFFKRASGIATLLHLLEQHKLIPSDWKGKRSAELGCGNGSGLWAVRSFGADVSGTDIQKYNAGAPSFQKSPLIEDFAYEKKPSLEFLAEQPDKSFDAIFAFNLESKVWTEKVANEALRVLRPDGIVVISWQYVNLSLPDASWPTDWPPWKRQKTIKTIYSPIYHRDGPQGKLVVQDVIDPKELVFGRVVVNPSLSLNDYILPEASVMIGKR